MLFLRIVMKSAGCKANKIFHNQFKINKTMFLNKMGFKQDIETGSTKSHFRSRKNLP